MPLTPNVLIQRTPKAVRWNELLCRIATTLFEFFEAISIGKEVIENGVGKLNCVFGIRLGNRNINAMRRFIPDHPKGI